jgi:hypothetical protein
MDKKQRTTFIGGVTGGVAGGVSGGAGAALGRHRLGYVLIAVAIGVTLPFVLHAFVPHTGK